MRKSLGTSLVACAILVCQASAALASPAARDTSPVINLAAGQLVPGGWSSLERTDSGVTMTFHTTGLAPGDAVTVWWVVFNDPHACSQGVLGLRCGEGDLSVSGTHASVLYAVGHVIGDSGVGDFSARLAVANTSGALFGPGLTDPWGADVHLIVHDHGPADPALLPGEIHSFDVCNPSCTDVQASPHESR
jgi:hypothetical protein